MYIYMYINIYIYIYICIYIYVYIYIYIFTTRPPAVTDVFVSGRNVGALRPGRRVGFRSLGAGWADDILRCTYYFCNTYSS